MLLGRVLGNDSTTDRASCACIHCIGPTLGRRTADWVSLDTEEAFRSEPDLALAQFSSVFEWEEEAGDSEFRVSRVRISGLRGEPLHDDVRPFTFRLITKAKEHKCTVVLFTNGVTLKDVLEDEDNARILMQSVDDIHVSLDAATRDTFKRLKGRDLFETVDKGLRLLCDKRGAKGSRPRVGIGYVVTQANSHEVGRVIGLANEYGADFVRFRPDLRGLRAISCRTWDQTCDTVSACQPESKAQLFLTDARRLTHGAERYSCCWAQFHCLTVGPDWHVYPCDHLTGAGKDASLGNLLKYSFGDIVKDAADSGRLGKRRVECLMCPPFNSEINWLTENLAALARQHGVDTLRQWLERHEAR